jgi:hypothetical protein
MTSSGGFTGIDVSDDDNVNVSLFLSHFEGFLSVQKKRKKIERVGNGECEFSLSGMTGWDVCG